MGNTLIKNNFVEKTAPDFLIDPDTEVYYEVNFVRVDKTSGNTTKEHRQTFKSNASHTVFMKIIKDFGLTPTWQKWLPDIDAATGKQIPGKGKWISAN